jgi:N-acyl-D-aspartate/D-glutamate deacylase
MTDVPARLFGLRGRGRVAEGWIADLTVVDPEQVDSGVAHRAYDLPGGAYRLMAEPRGVVRVLVNGVETIRDGEPTGERRGTVLRSGRDATGTTTG